MRDIRLQFCAQNESLWPLCDSQQNLNRQRQRKDLFSIWKAQWGEKSFEWCHWVMELGLGGRTSLLSYYTSRVPFGFSVWKNGTEATGSKGAVLYESRSLEGSRCKMKCINLFCAHARRSVANSLWGESQFGFKATNYWSAPIIHSSYSYFALTFSRSLPHSSVDHSDLKAFKTRQMYLEQIKHGLPCCLDEIPEDPWASKTFL